MHFKSVDVLETSALHESYKASYAAICGLLEGEVLDSFELMMQAGEVLWKALSISGPKAKAVDRLADRAWSGVSRSLEAWEHSFVEDETVALTKEEVECRGLARTLRVGLVGESLGFLKLQMHDQWRESALRLGRLDSQKIEGQTYREALESLGLGAMVRRLERIHEAYGKALGITDSKKATEQFEAWEAAFFHFLHGLHFKHRERTENNLKLFSLVMEPYEAALERGAERRRQARKSSDEPSTLPTPPTPPAPSDPQG